MKAPVLFLCWCEPVSVPPGGVKAPVPCWCEPVAVPPGGVKIPAATSTAGVAALYSCRIRSNLCVFCSRLSAHLFVSVLLGVMVEHAKSVLKEGLLFSLPLYPINGRKDSL